MKATFKTALSAAISASIMAAASYQQQGGTSLKATGIFAVLGAALGVANYLTPAPGAQKSSAPPAAPPPAE